MTDVILANAASDLATGLPSPVVSDAMFGMNFLFNRDRFDTIDTLKPGLSGSLPATFDDALRALQGAAAGAGGGSLRYPGGGVAEQFLDLSANGFTATVQNGQQVVNPLEFLDFCAATGMDMAFVLPTKRFLGEGNFGDRPAAVNGEEVYSYISRLLAEAHQRGVTISAIELGNEWWGGAVPIWTAAEYGRVASALSAIVQQAINDFRAANALTDSWAEPEILVQLGQGTDADAETAAIFAEFDTDAEQQAVDGTLKHCYIAGSFEQDSSVIGSFAQFDTWDQLVAASGDADWQADFSRHVTEWNVAGSNVAERGLRGVAPMISAFADMITAGVDAAQIWAVQQNTLSNLTFDHGLPAGVAGSNGGYWQGLSVMGEAFRLMQESLTGTRPLHLLQQDGNIIPETVALEGFAGDDRLVLFVSNRSAATDTVTLDLGDMTQGATHVYAVVLGVAKGSLATGPNPKPQLTLLSGDDLVSADGTLSLTLKPWQTARILYTYGETGVTMTGQNRHDDLTGGDYSDWLSGQRGNDLLTGLDGNDSLTGGLGADHLIGGGGTDRLIGMLGKDTLNGGQGDDMLSGGLGADTFVFTTGDGADAITDFTDGADRISFLGTGLTFADLTLRRLPNGVVIEYGDGDMIRLADVSLSQISAADFLFS